MTRAALHAAAGLLALTLRFLDWPGAIALGALLVVHNLALLPRYAPRLMRPPGPRADAGVTLYPVVVLGAILAFPDQPALAAAIWAILAYGDAAASLGGTGFGGPPWGGSSGKRVLGSVAFVAIGAPAGIATAAFVAAGTGGSPPGTGAAIGVAAVVAALAEAAPSRLDDNVRIGAAATATLGAWRLLDPGLVAASAPRLLDLVAPGALVSGLAGLVAWRVGAVDRSGLAAGVLVATLIWLGLGASGFAVLACFVAAGTASTRVGRARKEALGVAQGGRGRRRWTHVLANGGVAAILAGLSIGSPAVDRLHLAAVAALATAAFDTAATEIGQAWGRRAWRFPPGRVVPVGTPGAVSLAGTAAGLATALAVGGVATTLDVLPGAALGPVLAAATGGTTIESILGALPGTARLLGGDARNVLGTAAGAALAVLLVGSAVPAAL